MLTVKQAAGSLTGGPSTSSVDRGNDGTINDRVNRIEVPALPRRRARVRRRHDHQIQRGHDEDELPAVAPREVDVVRARAADPPPVTVVLIAPTGPRAPDPRAVDPRLRNHLRAVRRA